MKAKLLSITALCIGLMIVGSCKKDTAGPKIGLKLKSVNGTTFARNQEVIFKFEFTPKTAAADTMYVVRDFYTCAFYPNPDTLAFAFPEFPNEGKGDLEYSFVYSAGGFFFDGCYNGATARTTDSLHYSFWVKDADGNVSDTVRSPKIILLKQ
ncbi:MAG TPA: hypothetical protein VF145_02155 [Chitinophagaceae bacterium]